MEMKSIRRSQAEVAVKVAVALKARATVENDKLMEKTEAYDILFEKTEFLQLQFQLATEYQDNLQVKELSLKTQLNEQEVKLNEQGDKFDLALDESKKLWMALPRSSRSLLPWTSVPSLTAKEAYFPASWSGRRPIPTKTLNFWALREAA